MVVEILAGFLVAPFLVRTLGATTYGLWIVIGSLSGYFSLVDLGLRGSWGRQLAFRRAQQDWESANHIISSALLIFCCLTVITVIATAVAVVSLQRLFDIPAEQLANARLAMALVGVNLALSFPLQVFDGSLWAAQRFDLLNYVDIPLTAARAGLTFLLIRGADDIALLAMISLFVTIAAGVMKGVLSFRLDRQLAVSIRNIRLDSVRQLFAFGWWSFILELARLTKMQLTPILIGSLLGVAFVTPYSIARRLQDYAHRVLWTATGVLVPVATAFHAKAQPEQQQKLFIEGGKYSTAITLFLAGYLVCLGHSLIRLWMGPQFVDAAVLLIILMIGEFLHMTQSVAGSIILATARHRNLAWLWIVDTVLSVTLVALVAKRFGLIGVTTAYAVPQVLFAGVGILVVGCRVTEVGIGRYLGAAILPAIAMGALPVALLAGLTLFHTPTRWPVFLLYSAAYTFVYAGSCWSLLKPAFNRQMFGSVRLSGS